MKIFQISYPGFGGLGSVVFSLISADITSSNSWGIAFIGDQPLDTSYKNRCKDFKLTFITIKSKPGKPYVAWLKLAKWLFKEKPNVIFCHSINSIIPCRLYSWLCNAKLVAVEHTSNQVKTSNEWIASKVSSLIADKIIILTKEYKSELKKESRFFYREHKLHIVPNGIDTELFKKKIRQKNKKSTHVNIGMAARFSFSKRQDLLVKVLEEIISMRTNISIKLYFAGDGDELNRVKALVVKSSASKLIHFAGMLPESDVAPWLRDLDIYVHATEGETLSTSLLQAMATELPIVASNISGVHNLLGYGKYGLCVDNTPEAFAEAIISLYDHPESRSNLGRNARSRVLEKYSNKVMLQSYMKVVGVSSD